MTAEEIRRRFRWALVGYIILAAACATALWITFDQQRTIKHSQDSIRQLNIDDCDLVVSTTAVFVDFLKKEINLRLARATTKEVTEPVRSFDLAEVRYWTFHTLPKLEGVIRVHCNDAGGKK